MSASVLYDAPGPKARVRHLIFGIVSGVLILAGFAWLIYTFARPRETLGGATLPGLFDGSRWDVFLDPEVWGGIWNGVWNTLSAAGLAAVAAIIIGIA